MYAQTWSIIRIVGYRGFVECHRIEKKQQRKEIDACGYSPLEKKTIPGNDIHILEYTKYLFGSIL